MNIFSPCAVCFTEQHKKKQLNDKPNIMFHAGHLFDDGYILVECSKGHKSAVIYDERKHDILFDSACYAHLNGYEREAVTSYAASLERLYEFFIRVISRKYGLETKTFNDTWKLISKQSERQFGCFVLLYAMAFGKSYNFRNKFVEFRNKVTHQGYLPNDKETWEYAENVFNTKRDIMKLLKQNYTSFVEEEVKHEIELRTSKTPKNLPQMRFKVTPVCVNTNTNIAFEIENLAYYLHALKTRMKKK